MDNGSFPNVLRVAYLHSYPSSSSSCDQFPTIKASTSCKYPGQINEIIYLITKELNMTIIPTPLNNLLFNESIAKGMAMIKNNQVDTIAFGFQKTAERAQQFAFTPSIYKAQTGLIIKTQQSIYTGMGGFLNTYRRETWSFLFLALALQCLLAVIIRGVELRMQGNKKASLFEDTWQIISLQLLRPERMKFKTSAGAFFAFVFSLTQCAILLGIFSSAILSNIIRRDKYVPVNSFDTLIRRIADKQNYLVTSAKNSWFYWSVNYSRAYPYAELRESILINPIQVSPDVDTTMQKLHAGKAVVFAQDDDQVTYEALKDCNLISVVEGFPNVGSHLLLNKNSPLLGPISRVIYENLVFVRRIHTKYAEDRRYRRQCPGERSYKALGIFPYLSTLVICTVMFAFAVFVLVAEMGCSYLFKRTSTSPSQSL